MSRIGAGVREIRLHRGGEHRMIYVARFEEAIYVLHAFEKKTEKISKRGIELAKTRLSDIKEQRTRRHPHGVSARREWPIDGDARRAGWQRAKRAWVLVLAALAQPAHADEGQIVLKAGTGREQVTSHCQTCHSLDYIEMNAGFLDRAGWEKSVNKMIDVMHAPIPKDRVPAIVEYLTGSYGR